MPADVNVSIDNVKSIAANIQSRLKCRTIQCIDGKTKMENKQNDMYYTHVCFLSLSNTSGPNTIYLELQTKQTEGHSASKAFLLLVRFWRRQKEALLAG